MSRHTEGLAARLRRHEDLRLLFVKLPAPAEVELAGHAGFDAVILDTEHGSADGLDHHLRAADAVGIPALVRVPTPDPAPILRALDAGATGVVVAHVTGPEVARAAVNAAHYPPLGRRGLALTTRAGRLGTVGVGEHLVRAARETVVIVQIEDAEAVDRAAEIVAVEGVDGVLIGSTDLSVSLGHPGAPAHPDVAHAISRIGAAAAGQGLPVANVVSTGAEAQASGAPVAVFVATLLMRDAFRSVVGSSDGEQPQASLEPIVLVPGMLATADLWDGVAPALRELAPVRLGRIDLDTSVEEMAESLLSATPGRFSLVGHSLGAIVALAVARRAPERLQRLVLLAGSALPPTDEQLAEWRELGESAREGSFAALAARFANGAVPARVGGRSVLTERIEAMALSCGPRVLLRQLAAQSSRPDARPGLPELRVPTLVISGAEDTVCPPERQSELAAAIPDARLERLDGVGHYLPLEAPAEVGRRIAAWFSPASDAAAGA